MRIFREGQQVYAGKLQPVNTGAQTDMKRLVMGGRLSLGTALGPGEYVFQVVVYDALAREKYRMASQWADFEITK